MRIRKELSISARSLFYTCDSAHTKATVLQYLLYSVSNINLKHYVLGFLYVLFSVE
jgi:hypothetical protein